MAQASFESSVFINCPLDSDYAPILQAILFCIIYLGMHPRLATESNDSAAVRLQKITDLITASKYSVHDLSRIQSKKRGEYFRLNMPFELGLDFGCRTFFGQGRDQKRLLILEEKQYRYQVGLSDLAGCDIEAHGGKFETAIRKVRNWLVSEAHANAGGAQQIVNAYVTFQEWNYEKCLAAGFSEDDIQDYPTGELLHAMKEWVAAGMPI